MDYKDILEGEIKKLQNDSLVGISSDNVLGNSLAILEIVKYLNSEEEKKDWSLNTATIQKQVNDVFR